MVERESLGEESVKKVFEGRVVTTTRLNLLPRLMPAMIEALFLGFPGESGEAFTVTAPRS